MRRLLSHVFLITALAAAQTPTHAKRVKADSSLAPFVGTWKLVSSIQTMADGTVRPYGFGPHATGSLMYDATGHVCVQVVNPDRPKWVDPDHPTAEETRTAFDGFGGYCGRYTVDAEKHTLTQIPEVAFDPNVVDKPSPRTYSFDGNRLVYEGTDSSEGPPSHWTMTWERVQ
jgi:Lipocalin-like domain